jgi:archaeal cell division control protein 6
LVHSSVFKDESKLDLNFIPNRLPHRESQQRLLSEFFRFLITCPERMAQRVIITGEVGTGKTALSQRFGADVTSEATRRQLKVKYIHINCREHRGMLSLILHQAITVFDPQYPARGYSPQEMLSTLIQMLDELNTFVVLALDEFDSLIEKEGSDAVYKLTRLQEARVGKPQRVSFIFILRELSSISKLDDSAKSTMQHNIISLQRYGKLELVDILNERIEMAFERGTVPDDTVALVAELAISENGNARFSIELLWRSGKYADSEDLECVIPECVRQAVSSVLPGFRHTDLDALGFHEKLFLLGVARLFKESERGYVSITDAERAYKVLCEEYEVEANSHTQIWKYIQYFFKLGILKPETKTAAATEENKHQTMFSLPSIPAVELEKELSATLQKE